MTAYVFMIAIWLALYYHLVYRDQRTLTISRLHRREQIFTLCSCLTLFFIMGLRHYRVGTDTAQYLRVFHSSEYLDWKQLIQPSKKLDMEIGFKLYNYILYHLHVSDQVYLMIYAGIVSVISSVLIYKYCKHLFWGFYLHTTIGLFTMSMSGMRQTLACLICWLSVEYILKKKPFRFLFLVLLATSFHQSAIFFVIFYFARYFKITKLSGWFISGLCVLCVFLRSFLSPLMMKVLPEKYLVYTLTSDKYPINPILVAIGILIPMFCLFFWDRTKLKGEQDKSVYSLLFCGSFCYEILSALSLSSMMIGRMGMYFYFFNVVLLGNIIAEIEDRKTRYIISMFAILLPGYMFFKSQSLGISPYYFFWQTYQL